MLVRESRGMVCIYRQRGTIMELPLFPPSFLPSVQKEGSFLREIMEMEDNNTREENVEMRKEENSETRFEH